MKACCFAIIVLETYYYYFVAFSHGAMGLSAVCDCGISISYSIFDRILPTIIYMYSFMLTRSRLELLPVMFRLFVTELWPLIDVRISF